MFGLFSVFKSTGYGLLYISKDRNKLEQKKKDLEVLGEIAYQFNLAQQKKRREIREKFNVEAISLCNQYEDCSDYKNKINPIQIDSDTLDLYCSEPLLSKIIQLKRDLREALIPYNKIDINDQYDELIILKVDEI